MSPNLTEVSLIFCNVLSCIRWSSSYSNFSFHCLIISTNEINFHKTPGKFTRCCIKFLYVPKAYNVNNCELEPISEWGPYTAHTYPWDFLFLFCFFFQFLEDKSPFGGHWYRVGRFISFSFWILVFHSYSTLLFLMGCSLYGEYNYMKWKFVKTLTKYPIESSYSSPLFEKTQSLVHLVVFIALGVLVLLKFWQFSSELTKTWSSGTTECRVWIGNCNVKVWKFTEHKLHNIWHSVKFQQNGHTRGCKVLQLPSWFLDGFPLSDGQSSN